MHQDPRDAIVVDEQFDTDGDIVYIVSIKTHCIQTVKKLGELFNLALVYRPNNPHDHLNDW